MQSALGQSPPGTDTKTGLEVKEVYWRKCWQGPGEAGSQAGLISKKGEEEGRSEQEESCTLLHSQDSF